MIEILHLFIHLYERNSKAESNLVCEVVEYLHKPPYTVKNSIYY